MSVAVIYSPLPRPSKKQIEWEHKKGKRVIVHHLTDLYPKSFSQQPHLQNLVFNGDPWGFDMLVVDKLEHLCLGGTDGLVKMLTSLLQGGKDLIVCNDSRIGYSKLPLWFLRRIIDYPSTVARERRSIAIKQGRGDNVGGRPRLDHVTVAEIQRYGSVQAAAVQLGCSERTVRNRLKHGDTPTGKPSNPNIPSTTNLTKSTT